MGPPWPPKGGSEGVLRDPEGSGRFTRMRTVLLLSLANAAIAFTLTETRLFRALREWAKARSDWLGEFASCSYCLGHWTAFALVAVYRPRLFEAWAPLDYLLTALVVAWLAALQCALLAWLMEGAGK